MNASKFKSLLRQSHEKQFKGEDFQTVAIDLAEGNGIAFEDEEYTRLQSMPFFGCDCGFCATAPWQD